MSDVASCARCGGPLPDTGALAARCPRCMVEIGLESTSGFGGPDTAATEAARASIAAGPAAVGRYKILRLIGEGGMGIVYEAEQEHPRRTVALKIIKPGTATPELLRRFELESQALARLQHPGIAQIYEAGTADTGFGPQPYFAMELVRGGTPLDFVQAHHLNTRQRLELVAKIADAVHHAHQRGLIHRDLKPSNVLVDDTGQPKVLDFGVARVTDSEAQATLHTDAGRIVGTLAYMSPEQVAGDPLEIDTRTDVYALGVMLYELLAGRLPYGTRGQLHDAVEAIRREDPTRLSALDRAYRGDIETIAVKALEKDKTRRYTSAAELAADIRRHLKDEPIVARPPSAAYQLKKFARRHSAVVAAMAVVFVVLVAGVIVSAWQASRARRAEQAALLDRDRARQAEATTRLERDRATALEKTASAQRDLARRAEADATTERNRARAAEGLARIGRDRLLWQSLARESVRQSAARTDDDRAALLARQAFLFHTRTPNQPQFLVEDALQKAARPDAWSHVLLRSPATILSVAFSSSGTFLASGSEDGVVRISNLATPSAPPVLLQVDGRPSPIPSRGSGTSVVFGPDDTTLATVGADARVRLWNVRKTGASPVVLKGTQGALSFAYSGDRSRLASGHDGVVRVWSMRTPDAPPLVLENDGLATSLTFSRDGMRLASGSPDGLVRVWDLSRPAAPLASLQVRARLATSRGSPAAVVALSPDGARLAATSEIVNSSDPSVLVWDLSNMAAQPTAFRTGGDRPSAIAFSPDGERLAAGGTDKMVRVWNSRRPEVPGLSLRGHQDFVTALAFSPDGKRIASGSRDRTVRVWDITEDAEWQLLLPLKAPVPAFDLRAALDASFQPLAFSPDGARLASSDNDADVRIWDLRNSGTPPLVLQGHAGIVQPVAFSPDGSRLAAGGRDGSVQVWNLRNLQTRPMLLQGHAGAVVSVAFASDNTRLASAGADGTARIWDLRTARSTASTFYAALLPPSALPGGPSSLRGASFSSDLGRLVFAGLEPGGIPVRIWDLWSPRSAQTILPAPDTFQLASFVSFSPDGSRVAAGGTDFGVRLWNLRSPGSTPLTQDGLQGLGLSFSPDSSRLAFAKVSLTNDHLQLWDLRSPLEPPLVIPVFPNITSRPGPVDSVAFSPDGARLAILSRRTGQIAVWRLWSEAADYLCRQVWRNLTMDEWRQSVGDNIPYERTCPALPPGEGAPR